MPSGALNRAVGPTPSLIPGENPTPANVLTYKPLCAVPGLVVKKEVMLRTSARKAMVRMVKLDFKLRAMNEREKFIR
jgi:hypothetical protein